MERQLVIKGAREHNLRNISLTIPRNKLVVFTGLSGSGKSSLAFDTIYAEGQRRYLESLSAYARQFLEQMKKPELDSIEGLSPSISIEQKNISRNPRSTVGTVTEIYDYLRLLYARTGLPHCSNCGKPIQSQTVQQIVDFLLAGKAGTKFSVMAPIVRGKKGEYQKELGEMRRQGFVRARIDGEEAHLSGPIKLKKTLKHDISLYVDRLVLKPGLEARLGEALELATRLTGGIAEIEWAEEKRSEFFSTKFACPDCGVSFPEIEPRNFSFNSPHGACAKCDGLGLERQIDPDLVVPDPTLTIRLGALAPWAHKSKQWQDKILGTLSKDLGFSLDVPFKDIPAEKANIILYGKPKEGRSKGNYAGVIPSLMSQLEETSSWDEYELDKYISYKVCSECNGTRLKKEMLSVTVGELNIAQFCEFDVEQAQNHIKGLKLSKQHQLIAAPLLKEIQARLSFLQNVGLNYLTLSRSAASLSGGEGQRIRLATQIGSNLVGVLYILDEPSIGLHQRDNEQLIKTLLRLRDIGNSVIVVEHDEDTIESSDFVVDLGPGAGKHGGEVVFSGTPGDLKKSKKSLTGQYLSGTVAIPIPSERRKSDRFLKIRGAKEHNLKNLSVDIPLGSFVCVTGVSGSGKSSLIIDTLLKSLENHFAGRKTSLESVKTIDGLDELDKVVFVDQSPIGRTPRSNPATYTGIFTDIRTLFSQVPEARARGYTPSRFSFNVASGRCEACSGDGTLKISMHFLPDVFVTCEVCQGKRYNRETLDIRYRDKNISEVLHMTVEEACEFFERIPYLHPKLKVLLEVGLGYIELGQSAVTLSGGEAQRIKLAKELMRRSTGRTIYLLDEPTTGLHFDDIKKLLHILHSLVEQGNTVVVIEHNLDVIKQADHLIDLGPEGGGKGGEIIAEGTPETVAKAANSYTGKYLRAALEKAARKKKNPSSLDLTI